MTLGAGQTTAMKPADVARELQVSLRTARRLIEAGVIPSITITPRNIRVRRTDFDAYVDGLATA